MIPAPSDSSVAVVGAGVAGLAAAWLLDRGGRRVTLFEREHRLGGHTRTVTLGQGPDAGTPVDTGFIVMNHRTYPLLTRMLDALEVHLHDSDMSFSYHDERTGLFYSGSGLSGLFAQRRNLVRPSFHRMVREILRFFREAPDDLDAGRLAGRSVAEYLEAGSYSETFRIHHLVPMGAAIWSTPCERMLEFPAESFVRFFRNHGLLGVRDRPVWRTVVGGSHCYIDRILTRFSGRIRTACAVRRIRRASDRVEIAHDHGVDRFDHVVVAVHADEALVMLEDPTPEETRALGAWTYQSNPAALHHDAATMPPTRRAWASWNYRRPRAAPPDGPATLTYDMTRLQGLATTRRWFVTLNAEGPPPAADRIVDRTTFTHPTYSREAVSAQAALPALNGVRRTWFCGSYHGYGFHEDAVRSAAEVARAFGVEFP